MAADKSYFSPFHTYKRKIRPALTASLHMAVAILEKLLIFSAVLMASFTSSAAGTTLLTNPTPGPGKAGLDFDRENKNSLLNIMCPKDDKLIGISLSFMITMTLNSIFV